MSALLELLKAKKADLAAQSGNRKKTIKPAEGTSRWRVLPSWRGEGQQFWHDFGQHFVKKDDGTIAAIYMCTDKTYGRPCTICSAIEAGIKGASDDHTMEMLKEAKSGSRILLNVVHQDKTPNQVDIGELPPSVFEQIVGIAQEWEEAGESVFDLAKGKDFLITRTGTGLKTKYTVQVAAKANPLPAGVMSMLHNLDEYVQQESEAQAARALTAVRSVAGLPAPGAGGVPSAGASGGGAARFSATDETDDPYAVATPPKRAAAPAADVTDVAAKPKAAAVASEDIPDLDAEVAVAVAPKKATVAAAAPAAAAGTDDLDDLLASLG